MAVTLTVSTQGEVTLRQPLLDHLGVGPGDTVEIDLMPSGRVQVRAAAEPAVRTGIDAFIGSLRPPGQDQARGTAPGIDEMNRAVAEGWSGRS